MKAKLAKKTKTSKKVDYTYDEKNIYRTGSNTFRVRVGDFSYNAPNITQARKQRQYWLEMAKSESII